MFMAEGWYAEKKRKLYTYHDFVSGEGAREVRLQHENWDTYNDIEDGRMCWPISGYETPQEAKVRLRYQKATSQKKDFITALYLQDLERYGVK